MKQDFILFLFFGLLLLPPPHHPPTPPSPTPAHTHILPSPTPSPPPSPPGDGWKKRRGGFREEGKSLRKLIPYLFDLNSKHTSSVEWLIDVDACSFKRMKKIVFTPCCQSHAKQIQASVKNQKMQNSRCEKHFNPTCRGLCNCPNSTFCVTFSFFSILRFQRVCDIAGTLFFSFSPLSKWTSLFNHGRSVFVKEKRNRR